MYYIFHENQKIPSTWGGIDRMSVRFWNNLDYIMRFCLQMSKQKRGRTQKK